jgi:hypothetical protein
MEMYRSGRHLTGGRADASLAPPPAADVAAWIDQFAARGQDRATSDHVVGLMVRAISSAVPSLRDDPELLRHLHQSSEGHWRGFLAALWPDMFRVEPGQATFALTRATARRGAQPFRIFKAYIAAQHAVWRYLTDTVTEEVDDEDLRRRILTTLWDRLSEWTDATIELATTAYLEEIAPWAGEAEARRVKAMRAIIGGANLEPGAATNLLGHPVRHHQTALIAWADPWHRLEGLDGVLQTVVRRAANPLHARGTFMMSSSATCLWAWVATASPPDLDNLDGIEGLDDLLAQGMHLAVGQPAQGCLGIRRSHLQARKVQRLMMEGRPHTLTRYQDVELIALAAAEGGLDALHDLANRELGGLGRNDVDMNRLRATAVQLRNHGYSAETTGRAMGLHPNTIRYRIKQIEAETGHLLLERVGLFELALQCIEYFGPEWNPPATDGPDNTTA